MNNAAGHDRHRHSADDRTQKKDLSSDCRIPENQEFNKLAMISAMRWRWTTFLLSCFA